MNYVEFLSAYFIIFSKVIHMVKSIFRYLFILLFAIHLLTTPVLAEDENQTSISVLVNEAIITADSSVQNAGYFVNEIPQAEWISISTRGDTIIIRLSSIPYGMMLKTVVDDGEVRELMGHPVTIEVRPHTEPLSIKIHLSLIEDPNAPPKNPFPGLIPGIIPSEPEQPENPDTPGTDEPGSDEPLIPILPPAGWVKNIAGFASLAAGFLLLFLLFFMRGNLVYRTLKKHAKKHGEKPDKEEKKHLKEIASAVVSRIKDDEKYPEWRKNTDVMKHLGVDICLLLDEMKYREAVPREALVIEILEKARGKINRHRL